MNLLALLTLLVQDAVAQDRGTDLATEAELHFDRALDAYRAGDYELALERMMRSNRLVANRNVIFNIARIHEAMGNYDEAYSAYARFLDTGVDDERRAITEEALEKLQPRVALVRIETDPPGATVYIDRRELGARGLTPLTLSLEPGEHTVMLSLEGHTESDVTTTMVVGEQVLVNTSLDRIVGTLSVTGLKGASVLFDGQDLCVVPCEEGVPVGQHTVTFEKEGYRSEQMLVVIEANQTSSLVADPDVAYGSVRVEVDEEGATVEVDGTTRGFAPAVVSVPAGKRLVRISKEGFAPFEKLVDVQRDAQTDLGVIRLDPLDIVQSASRVAEDATLAPASITVVGPEEFEAFGYTNYTDALRGVRGVTTINPWNSAATAYIRGAGGGGGLDRGKSTRLLVDGLVQDTQFASDGYHRMRDLHVERIEVQRGAGSVTYGTGVMAGLISVYKDDRIRETFAEGEVGTLGREANGRLKVGVGDEELGIWLGIQTFRGRGLDVVVEDVPIYEPVEGPLPLLTVDDSGNVIPSRVEDVEVDGYVPINLMTFEGKAWYKDVLVSAGYTDALTYSNDGQRGGPLTPGANPQSDALTRGQIRYLPQLTEAFALDGRLYYQRRVNRLHDQPVTSISDSPFGPILVSLDSRGRATDEWYGAELRSVLDVLRPVADDPLTTQDESDVRSLRILSGAEVHHYPQALATADIVDAVPTPESIPGQIDCPPERADALFCILDRAEEQSRFVIAFSGQVDWRPVKVFKASAGARLDIRRTVQPQLNPRLAAMLIPTDRDVIKVMYGRGFRIADVVSRISESPGVSVPNTDLRPERANYIEAEATHMLTDDIQLLGSGWYTQYDDLQLQLPYVPDAEYPDGGLQWQNAGQARTYGIDGEITRRFKSGWMANAWYSHQRSETQYPQGDGVGDYQRTLYMPRNLAAIKMIAPLPAGMRVATRVVFEDRRPISARPDDATEPAVITDLVLSGRTPSQTVSWRAGAYNLFDTRWVIPGTTAVPYPEVPQGGLQLRASVEFHGRVKPKEAL